MAFLRIHCGYCGGTWEIGHRLRELDPARRCPHCDSRIDGATWREKILPAYNSMQAANMALIDDHMEYHCPGFEVDYIQDGTFQNASNGVINELGNLSANMEVTREEVTELRGLFHRLCDDMREYYSGKEGKKR